MKTKPFFFIVIIWFLFLGGMVHAQQDKNQGEGAGAGQSPSEYDSYPGGKEHYLPDSPHYMAGKRHYLQRKISPEKRENGQEAENTSVSKDGRAAGQGENLDDQRKIQIQIEINKVVEEPPKDYGILYLPVIPPKHHKGGVRPPRHVDPNPPQTGNANPDARGGFHHGLTIFR